VGTYHNDPDSGLWALKGHYNDTTSTFLASVEHTGANTEYFEGVVDKNTLIGNWRMALENIPFKLTRDKMNDLKFKVRYDTFSIKEIEIYRGESQIQTLIVTCPINSMFINDDMHVPAILHSEDLNFDGYDDLAIVVAGSGGDLTFQCIYFYNSKEDKFIVNNELDNIVNPEVDVLHNTVIATGTHMGMVFQSNYYSLVNGHFTLVRTATSGAVDIEPDTTAAH
jgi:hypothetical protein